MKKIIISIITAAMFLTAVFGCSDKANLKIMVPNGITLIAIGGIIDNEDYDIQNVEGANLIISAMTAKSHDIIIAPLNVAAKIFMAGGSNYKLAAMLTFGNLYIVSKENVALNSMADLEGKKIIAFSQNATPDIILQAALSSQNVTCDIEYQSGVSEVIPFFIGDNYEYALVAEPVLSQLQIKQNLKLNIIDLQEVLKNEISLIPQAGIFVNPEYDKNKIDNFLNNLQDNVNLLNTSPENYAQTILTKHNFFQNLTVDVILSAIQSGRVIDYLKAKDNIQIAKNYFDLLNTYNPNILNGNLPELDFYY